MMPISDNEVRQAFKKIVDLPDIVNGIVRLHQNQNKDFHLDGRINIQVYRGQPCRNWEGAPKGSCSRCMALFDTFDVIPKYCFDCYKVLVELRTVLELFKLQMVFERIELPRDNSRKCIIDNRPSSAAMYKGFVYCRSLEEAYEICARLGDVIAEEISPEVLVKVKRGCTEYPEKYPDYAKLSPDKEVFPYREEWKFYEDYVDNNMVFQQGVDGYDDDGKGIDPSREILAFQYWLRYAATVGDNSYLTVTGGSVREPISVGAPAS